jgi:hypothetical protein
MCCLIGTVDACGSAKGTNPSRTSHRAIIQHQSISSTHMDIRAILKTQFSDLDEEDRFDMAVGYDEHDSEVDGVVAIQNWELCGAT